MAPPQVYNATVGIRVVFSNLIHLIFIR